MFLENNKNAQTVSHSLSAHGFKVYVVGGAVRDAALRRSCSDIDLLTDAPAWKIKEIFSGRKVSVVGKAFPVCLVDGVEVASARSGETEFLESPGFPESDLGCRDFTFNAMAWDIENKIVIDPFNGKKDLDDRVVKFTGDPEVRIKEDPIRMVRACRFAAMIDGGFEKRSFEAILKFSPMLDSGAARERLRLEIKKAMALTRPSLFFYALEKTGLLIRIFPSLDRCHGLSGGPHHGETVFAHCLMVGDALPAKLPLLRLAGFLHDTGKFDAAKIKEGGLTFAGHENDFSAAVRDLEDLRFSNKEVAYIKAMIQSHMRPLTDESTPKAVRRLLAMLDGFGLDYKDFMRMRIADRKGNLAKPPYTLSQIRERLAKLFCEMDAQNALTLKDLKISGNEIIHILGLDPGPEVGRFKEFLLEKVLDDPGLNNPHDLRRICRSLQIER